MAQWNTNVKHEPSSINNGNQYEKKDRVSREQLNALAENSFYAMEKSDDAVSKSEQAVETANEAFEQAKVTGTQIYSDGVFQSTFDMKQATADFAESERQKTINLCCLKTATVDNAGVTITLNEDAQTITLNGTCTAASDFHQGLRNLQPFIKNMSGKTVTISQIYVSGTMSGGFQTFLGTKDNDNVYNDRFQIGAWNQGVIDSSSRQITFNTNDTYDTLMFYAGRGNSFDNFTFKIQIEEGNVKTDWTQPYGPIVHKKDMEDVEQVETIYDMWSSDSNINWGYTGGIPTGTTITNKDFTKYKKLIVWYYNAYLGGVCEIPLNAESGHAYRGTHCGISWDGNVAFTGGCSLSVKDAKTTFNVEYFIYFGGISDTARVTKIVGVF